MKARSSGLRIYIFELKTTFLSFLMFCKVVKQIMGYNFAEDQQIRKFGFARKSCTQVRINLRNLGHLLEVLLNIQRTVLYVASIA